MTQLNGGIGESLMRDHRVVSGIQDTQGGLVMFPELHLGVKARGEGAGPGT